MIKADMENKAKKTILVVEDEDSLQLAIKMKMKISNYNYLPATSAEEALEILKTNTPDLIWLDLLMPGMGGLALLEKLRQNEAWSNLPVMIVSVSAGTEKIRRAFELNVVDYVVKSQYKLEDIINKIDDYVA